MAPPSGKFSIDTCPGVDTCRHRLVGSSAAAADSSGVAVFSSVFQTVVLQTVVLQTDSIASGGQFSIYSIYTLVQVWTPAQSDQTINLIAAFHFGTHCGFGTILY